MGFAAPHELPLEVMADDEVPLSAFAKEDPSARETGLPGHHEGVAGLVADRDDVAGIRRPVPRAVDRQETLGHPQLAEHHADSQRGAPEWPDPAKERRGRGILRQPVLLKGRRDVTRRSSFVQVGPPRPETAIRISSRLMRFSLALFGLSLLTHAACESRTAPLLAPGGPVVTLNIEGSEPRDPLRYAYEKLLTQSVILSLQLTISPENADSESPAVLVPGLEVTVNAVTIEVDEAGTGRFALSLAGAHLISARPILRLPGPPLAALDGLSGRMVVTNLGEVSELVLDVPETLPAPTPTTRTLLLRLKDSMKGALSPLPVEAVGLGGQWQRRSVAKVVGVDVIQTATYTLLSMQGDRWRIHVAQQSELAPTEGKRLEGYAKGELEVDPRRPLVDSATLTLKQTLSTNVNTASASRDELSAVLSVRTR